MLSKVKSRKIKKSYNSVQKAKFQRLKCEWLKIKFEFIGNLSGLTVLVCPFSKSPWPMVILRKCLSFVSTTKIHNIAVFKIIDYIKQTILAALSAVLHSTVRPLDFLWFPNYNSIRCVHFHLKNIPCVQFGAQKV